MFWTTVEQSHADLEDLRRVVATNEALRNLLFPTVIASDPAALAEALAKIRQTAPAKPIWAFHDYCAAITRLYSVLEDFIDSILKDYLALLPTIFPNYNELPSQTLTQHRMGVSQILSKLGDRGIFRHLTELETLRGIADGYSGKKYVLLSDAFLTDTQNYRAEQINNLFAYVGVSNIWAGVERHPSVSEYMKTRDPNDTPKTLLKKIVDERNLAAHSGITNVLGPDEILSMISFIREIVTAVAEIARKTCASLECSAGIRVQMFQVEHLFDNMIVGVKFLTGSVRVGDSLIAIDRRGAYRVTILSIRHGKSILESA